MRPLLDGSEPMWETKGLCLFFTPHVEARAEGRVRVWSWVFSSPLKSASEAQDEHSAPGAVVLTMGGNY